MKLNVQQVAKVHDQTGGNPIPENHPLFSDLKDVFGDHTFYVVPDGLCVWETMETSNNGGDVMKAMVVASWTDETRTELVPHDPEPTSLIVTLDDPGPETAA